MKINKIEFDKNFILPKISNSYDPNSSKAVADNSADIKRQDALASAKDFITYVEVIEYDFIEFHSKTKILSQKHIDNTVRSIEKISEQYDLWINRIESGEDNKNKYYISFRPITQQ